MKSKYSGCLETLDQLLALAERSFRWRLSKEHSHLKRAQIERLVRLWYLERPGAELGDSCGKPRRLKS